MSEQMTLGTIYDTSGKMCQGCLNFKKFNWASAERPFPGGCHYDRRSIVVSGTDVACKHFDDRKQTKKNTKEKHFVMEMGSIK